MFIVHPKGTYVRPHKHIKKAESMIVLKGKVDYLIFNENGEVVGIIPMGIINQETLFIKVQAQIHITVYLYIQIG